MAGPTVVLHDPLLIGTRVSRGAHVNCGQSKFLCVLIFALVPVLMRSQSGLYLDGHAPASIMPAMRTRTGSRALQPNGVRLPRQPAKAALAGERLHVGMFSRSDPTSQSIVAQASAKRNSGSHVVMAKSGGNFQITSSAEAAALLQNGWTLLDVRPPSECAKGRVKGAVEVPLYIPDQDSSPVGLLRRYMHWGQSGWWAGTELTKENTDFISQAREQISKDGPGVIVACQEGMRSLAAIQKLEKEGYQKLAWIQGGFIEAKPGDLPTVDDVDIRLSAVGGVSGMVGWTPAQQKAANDK